MPAASTPVFIAQHVRSPPTIDRLGAPDQSAIPKEKGPSRWAGSEINLTPSSRAPPPSPATPRSLPRPKAAPRSPPPCPSPPRANAASPAPPRPPQHGRCSHALRPHRRPHPRRKLVFTSLCAATTMGSSVLPSEPPLSSSPTTKPQGTAATASRPPAPASTASAAPAATSHAGLKVDNDSSHSGV